MRTITRMCGIVFMVFALVMLTANVSLGFGGYGPLDPKPGGEPDKRTPDKPAVENPQKSDPVQEPKYNPGYIPKEPWNSPSIGPSKPSSPLPGEGGGTPSKCGPDIVIGAGIGLATGALKGVGGAVAGAIDGAAAAAAGCGIKEALEPSTANYVVPKGTKTGWKSPRNSTPK